MLTFFAFSEYIGDRRDGINHAVNSEIGDVFKGKTTNQLKLLEKQIKDKLSGGEGIDVGEIFVCFHFCILS